MRKRAATADRLDGWLTDVECGATSRFLEKACHKPTLDGLVGQ
jgi:hypothetical protein